MNLARWWFELRGGYTDVDLDSVHIKMNGSPFDRNWMPPVNEPPLTRAERNALRAEMRDWVSAYRVAGENMWSSDGRP